MASINETKKLVVTDPGFGTKCIENLPRTRPYIRVVNNPAAQTEPRKPKGENNMNTNHPLKKMIVAALLSGGVALAGLGMTAGTAQAAPAKPGPTIDHSDYAGPIVECNQCRQTLPGGGGFSLPGGFKPSGVAAH
jgi:hypothetical protein